MVSIFPNHSTDNCSRRRANRVRIPPGDDRSRKFAKFDLQETPANLRAAPKKNKSGVSHHTIWCNLKPRRGLLKVDSGRKCQRTLACGPLRVCTACRRRLGTRTPQTCPTSPWSPARQRSAGAGRANRCSGHLEPEAWPQPQTGKNLCPRRPWPNSSQKMAESVPRVWGGCWALWSTGTLSLDDFQLRSDIWL